MSDCDDFMKVLKGWREEDSKAILQVLTRITQIKTFTNHELDDILKVVVDFHKEIGKADEGEVDPKWFELTINLKKKLKKMQETQKSKI
jgi:aminoglycoside phosphotransferase family enzyme